MINDIKLKPIAKINKMRVIRLGFTGQLTALDVQSGKPLSTDGYNVLDFDGTILGRVERINYRHKSGELHPHAYMIFQPEKPCVAAELNEYSPGFWSEVSYKAVA